MNKQKKHIIILIGPPGSGKGSLSQKCVRTLGWRQLSTGDLCRQHIADKTEIGNQIDFFIQSGKLIPDSLVIEMVEQWLKRNFDDFDVLILDGFPRTLAQAKALDALLEKDVFTSVDFHVVELKVDDAVVEQRLTSRLICPVKGCEAVYSKIDSALKPRVAMECDHCPGVQLMVRADDTPESVKRRLQTYHKHADELIRHYSGSGASIVKLDVNRPIDVIFDDFVNAIGFVK